MNQNYANHRRIIPMFHIFTFLLIVAVFIGALVNLFHSFGTGNLYSASLIVVIAIILGFQFYYLRIFPLKAQDRAIRTEENFRHYVLTGKPLDANLSIRQIIGLRFAEDEEFLELEKKAVAENLSENDIKKAIENWKADTYRV